jgi:hypothetical protein
MLRFVNAGVNRVQRLDVVEELAFHVFFVHLRRTDAGESSLVNNFAVNLRDNREHLHFLFLRGFVALTGLSHVT